MAAGGGCGVGTEPRWGSRTRTRACWLDHIWRSLLDSSRTCRTRRNKLPDAGLFDTAKLNTLQCHFWVQHLKFRAAFLTMESIWRWITWNTVIDAPLSKGSKILVGVPRWITLRLLHYGVKLAGGGYLQLLLRLSQRFLNVMFHLCQLTPLPGQHQISTVPLLNNTPAEGAIKRYLHAKII